MKKNKSIIIILFLFIVLIVMLFMYFNGNSFVLSTTEQTETQTESSIKEVTVGTQTIEKNLTSSGEISSNLEETLSLNTYRYFNQMCVDTNDFVSEVNNILEYTNGTYLVAPYDCVITKISVPEEGGRCTSQNGITIQSTESLKLSISVDETEISEVKITPNAYEDKTYTGIITKINQVGTYASNGTTFTGTVTFENDGDLKIGMSASCSITLEKAENVVAVPIEAVQTENNSKYVIVKQQDGTTKNVTVETGISNDAYVEILSGLSGGETIQMIEQTTNSTQKNSGNGMQNSKMMQGFENDRGGEAPGMGGPGQMQGGN